MSREVGISEARYRLRVAPRFACPASFAERLSVGRIVADGARFVAGDSFAPIGAAALDALIGAAGDPSPALSPTDLALFAVPDRIRARFWSAAEKTGSADLVAPGLERVFSDVAELLRFKQLPLPPRARFEVAVSAPGLPSTRAAAGGAGLGFGERVAPDGSLARIAVGGVNLGDEAAFLSFVPFPPAALSARLATAGVRSADGLAPQALADRFFGTFPDEPLLRLRLEPGEGLWLPPLGVVHDGTTSGRKDLDVWLRIDAEPPLADGG